MSKKYVNEEYEYSGLSGEIIGAAFEVQNKLGCGHREKYYQEAIAVEFKKRGLKFEREVAADLLYKEEKIARRRFDFIIEGLIVVEIKVGQHLRVADFQQIKDYIRISDVVFGLLLLFSNDGVKARRVVNIY